MDTKITSGFTGRLRVLMLLVGLSFAIESGASSAFASPLYVVEDGSGVITFTNRQPVGNVSYKVFEPGKVKFSTYYQRRGRARPSRPIPSEYDALISLMARSYGLDPVLVKALVHVESGFQPSAISPKGAQGLMQLMPQTARRFDVRDPYHPVDNVKGGIRYLNFLRDRYNGNIRLMLAAYNAGEGAVDKYRGIPPYRETQEYVTRVLAAREMYRCVERGDKNCNI